MNCVFTDYSIRSLKLSLFTIQTMPPKAYSYVYSYIALYNSHVSCHFKFVNQIPPLYSDQLNTLSEITR